MSWTVPNSCSPLRYYHKVKIDLLKGNKVLTYNILSARYLNVRSLLVWTASGPPQMGFSEPNRMIPICSECPHLVLLVHVCVAPFRPWFPFRICAHILFLVLLTWGADPPSGRSSPLPLRPESRPVTPPLCQTPKHFHVPGRSWSAPCHCSDHLFCLFVWLMFVCLFVWLMFVDLSAWLDDVRWGGCLLG